MISLTHKHIFIAGGSRGIGAAAARLCVQAGAKVTVTYIKAADTAKALAKDIGGFACGGDLSIESEAQRMVAEAIAAQGPIHGTIITAGIFEPGFLPDMTVEFWDRMMAVNVRSTFVTMKALTPSMIAAGGGSAVIVASTAGQRGSEEFSAYATSKGAQIMFMRSMARELAKHKIRCNCVAPGWTDTDMASAILSAEDKINVGKTIPLGRIGKAEEPAAAALFLLSDLAAFITGSTITVDGGFDMRG